MCFPVYSVYISVIYSMVTNKAEEKAHLDLKLYRSDIWKTF